MLAVTPQRMRMIVEGFIDVLELGLEKEGQMVVGALHLSQCFAKSSDAFEHVWL